MTSPLANPNFRWLFSAQVFSLVGTGLLTVALSLAAFRIGGGKAAGQVLGVIFALKMVAYVGIAPLIEAVLSGVNRKIALVSLDFGRLLLLLLMAFTENTYQIVLLSFVFFVLSAGFTPLYQSVIPDVVPDKDAYARALSWSRIAYTLESSPEPNHCGCSFDSSRRIISVSCCGAGFNWIDFCSRCGKFFHHVFPTYQKNHLYNAFSKECRSTSKRPG